MMWSRVSWWLFVASERLYQILLHVYPREFRREYGPHMVQVFRDCCGDAAAQDGAAGVAKLWLHVLGDLSRSALNERAAALRTSTRRLAYAREQNYDFTKPAITVMAHALEEAKRLHHGFIGTEHLLLGLLTTSGDAGRDAIDLLGVSPEQIQTRVMQMLQKEQSGR